MSARPTTLADYAHREADRARLDAMKRAKPAPTLCSVPVTHALTADELLTLTMEHRRLHPSGTTQLSPAMIALWACAVVQERIAALRAAQMGVQDNKLVYLFQDKPQVCAPYDGHNDEAKWDGAADEEYECMECGGSGTVTPLGTYESGEHAIEVQCAMCAGSGVRS